MTFESAANTFVLHHIGLLYAQHAFRVVTTVRLSNTLVTSILKLLLQLAIFPYGLVVGCTMSGPHGGSKILNKDYMSTLSRWLELPNMKVTMLFSSSVDKLDNANFHEKCDRKGPTLTLFKALKTGHIFGGYASISWEDKGWSTLDPSAFLFRLDEPALAPPKDGEQASAVCPSKDMSPRWGREGYFDAADFQFDLRQHSIVVLNGFGQAYAVPRTGYNGFAGFKGLKTFFDGEFIFEVLGIGEGDILENPWLSLSLDEKVCLSVWKVSVIWLTSNHANPAHILQVTSLRSGTFWCLK